ncbi:MAG: serine/threonine-protein kinase [Polyangiaceae bacterium]
MSTPAFGGPSRPSVDTGLAVTLPSDPQITIRPLPRHGDPTRIDGTLLSPVAPKNESPTVPPPPAALPEIRRRELPQLSVDLDATVNTGRSNPPSSPDRGPDLEVRGLLGEGGMGRVLLARQHSLDREVAVKTIRQGASDHERESLLAEGAIVGFLEHPSIIPVHALGLDPVGRPVLVMKRIDGVEWSDLLDDPRHPRWPVSMPNERDRLADHVEILIQVCNALHFAHERGVLHRDVKPQNVLVGQYGDVYLADWGIAHRTSTPGIPGMAGTPAFMAPEMASGDALDERTDVYLLGATLHRVLTGKPRHAGATVRDTLEAAIASAPFDYDPSVPPELAALANEATSRRAAKRPANVLAFRARLASHLRTRASVALAASAATRLEKLRALVEDEAPGDVERGGDIDVLIAETRFGLREALAQWADNPRAKELLEVVDSIAAVRRARAAEHARKAHELNPELSERQRKLGLLLIAGAGVSLSIMGVVQGPRYVPSHAELIGQGFIPLAGLGLAIAVFRRHLTRSTVNRVSCVMLATIMLVIIVGRIVAARADIPAAQVVVMDALIMTTGATVGSAMTFRWVLAPAAVMLACAVVAALAPAYASFAFALATAAALLASVAFAALRVGVPRPPQSPHSSPSSRA